MRFLTVDIECISGSPTTGTTDLIITPTSSTFVTKDDVLVHDQHVVAISCMAIDTEAKNPVILVADMNVHWDDADRESRERALLVSFSDQVRNLNPQLPRFLDYDFVTYAGNRYDMPVLLYRMFHHGLEAEWLLEPKDVRYKYSTKGHFDIAEYLSNYGNRIPPMSAISQLMGLPGKLDGLDGSHVAEMVASHQWEALSGYCALDVVQETLIRLRIEYTRGLLGVHRYNEVAGMVLRTAIRGPHKVMRCLAQSNVFIEVPETNDVQSRLIAAVNTPS